MAESVRDYMKHEDAMHACENREEREYEKTGVTDTGEQSGSIKNCCDLRSGCSIYRGLASLALIVLGIIGLKLSTH